MAQYQVPDPWMTWDGRRFERELCTECIVTAMCAVYLRRDIPYVKRGERFSCSPRACKGCHQSPSLFEYAISTLNLLVVRKDGLFRGVVRRRKRVLQREHATWAEKGY